MTSSRSSRRPVNHGRTSRARARQPGDRPWLFGTTVAFLVTCTVFGGGEPGSGLPFELVALAGTCLLAVSLFEGGLHALRGVPWIGRAFLAALLLVPLLQLVPLPPALWTALPGRTLPSEVLAAGTGAVGWHPMTLSVDGTLLAALYALWVIGLVMAVVQLRRESVQRLFTLLFVIALVQIAIGAIQFLSQGNSLDFYNSAHRTSLLGFFANKNHIGLFLALSLLTGFAAIPPAQLERRETLLTALPVVVLTFAAIVATISRAAVLLGLVALAIIAILYRLERGRGTTVKFVVALVVVVAVLAGLASTDLGQHGLARFGMVGNDLRWLFWAGSVPLAHAYFPVGAGLGSFVSVFEVGEHLAWVKPTYVNHAHNDYLEIVIETGVFGPLVIAAGVLSVAAGVWRAWGTRATPAGRYALIGAAIMLLCALHSFGDYPLRRMGIAAVFFFAFAAVLRVFGSEDRPSASSPRSSLRSPQEADVRAARDDRGGMRCE